MLILLLIFFAGCITLMICYGFIRYYYLKDKYENLIAIKFKSIGYKVLSIKTVEKPTFIKESEIQELEFFNPFPIITTYRIVELEFIDKKQSAYISIERILFTKLTLKYFIDTEGKGDYKLLE